MKLPPEYVEKFSELLGDEAAEFFTTYNQPKYSGLRINTLKVSVQEFNKLFPHSLEKVPFCQTGFYFNEDIQPGKHPFHLAGLYYIQEPSAMFVVETLDPKPQEKVLDLCAAPGGKSTQIAAMMGNTGLLVSNDIKTKRTKALSVNIERLGITNCIITNEPPERLSNKFSGYFDKILVDAPCSGEGMFRKDPDAIKFWSPEKVISCSQEQSDILEYAYKMLKEGGILVYSTCTFSPEENEQIIEKFLEKHPDLEIIPIEKTSEIKDGKIEWTSNKISSISGTARLWPQHLKGEGHFVAKILKTGRTAKWKGKNATSNITETQIKDFREFEKNFLNFSFEGSIYAFKDQLYSLPENCPNLDGIKVIRTGLHLGQLKKHRFEPNHSLAMALKKDNFKFTYNLTLEKDLWKKYVKGETLLTDVNLNRGWLAVTIEGFPLGWGKEVKGVLKNFYPKGLRIPL